MSNGQSPQELAVAGMWETSVTYEALHGDPQARVMEGALGNDVQVALEREALREKFLVTMLPGSKDDEEGLPLSQTGVIALAQAMHTAESDPVLAPHYSIMEDLVGDVALQVADIYLEHLENEQLFDELEIAADEDASCDGDVVAYLAATIRSNIEAKVVELTKKKKKPTTLKKKKHPQLPEKDA
jgi:hypothetical protein